ncbi:MAG: ribbon-helix-helix protein, CopG family [Acidimicrobiia bacterium]|nr:ribbon-helix-helix protein, CopG family [Acidimicrobiia bacterium]
MSTTIRIDDDLYRRAKATAARRGTTVGQLIEDALRMALRPHPVSTQFEVPELPVFGGSGTMPGVDLADPRTLREAMGEGAAGRARD